jgi:hypothetical protein
LGAPLYQFIQTGEIEIIKIGIAFPQVLFSQMAVAIGSTSSPGIDDLLLRRKRRMRNKMIYSNWMNEDYATRKAFAIAGISIRDPR